MGHPVSMRLVVTALVVLALPAGASAASTEHRYDLDGRSGAKHRLDVHDAGGRDRPVLVWVHGGGWAIGDKGNDMAAKAKTFRDAGFLFVSVNYRLSPRPAQLDNSARVRFPVHPRDVGEAVAWMHRRARGFGGDPERIVIAGHSAGAHLAALVATDPTYTRRFDVPAAAMRGSLVMDTDALDITSRLRGAGPRANAIYHNAFGTPAENARDGLWRAASPTTHADRRDPRTLFVTQASSPSRIRRGNAFAQALGQRPADAVLAVPKSHEQINRDIGRPAGAAMTKRVLAFVKAAVKRR